MATAETIAKTLGGRKAGGGWMARCPAHDDRAPSLSICEADDGKVLVGTVTLIGNLQTNDHGRNISRCDGRLAAR